MTISQPNPEINDAGAEVDEFLDAPPEDDEEAAVNDEPDPEASPTSSTESDG